MPRRFLIRAGTAEYPFLNKAAQRLELVPEHIRQVTDLFGGLGYEIALPDIVSDPSSRQLQRALENWFTSANRQEDDVVVFYYTGHGISSEDRTHFLATHDTEERDGELSEATAVRTDNLARLMLARGPVSHLLVILDTCHAGGGSHDLAREAMRVKWDGTKELWVIASSQPKKEQEQGFFIESLVEATKSVRWHGTSQPFVQLPLLIRAVNEGLGARSASQKAMLHAVSAEVGEFIPNTNFQRPDPAAVEREEFDTHWGPKARGEFEPQRAAYFSGRDAVLRELKAWFEGPPDGRARVVTGGAGSGKSSVIGRLVALSRPESRSRLLSTGHVPLDTVPPERAIGVRIHARTLTLEDVVSRIAFEARIEAGSAEALLLRLDAKLSGEERPLGVAIDALDESVDPRQLIARLLNPLAARKNIHLLVGARRELLPTFRDVVLLDLDQDGYFDVGDLERYIQELLLERNNPRSFSPYKGREEDAQAAAVLMARFAARVFLVGRLIAETLLSPGPSFDSSALERELKQRHKEPWGVPEAFDFYLSRFLHDERKVRDLLCPLAFAEGAGLPWRDIWAPLARELSGSEYCDSDIDWVLKYAGVFVSERLDESGSVYRLYHQALAEHLRTAYAESTKVHRAFTRILNARTTDVKPGQKDWRAGDSYARTHLATHAANTGGGQLDDLLTDPGFIVAAGPDNLLRALPNASSDRAGDVAQVYRLIAHRLHHEPADERASYLEMTAVQCLVPALAERIRERFPQRPWSTAWAQWRWPRGPQVIAARHRGAVNALAVGQVEARQVVVSGGDDGTVQVCDLISGLPIVEPIDFGDEVSAVALAARGGRTVIIAGGPKGVPHISDIEAQAAETVTVDAHRGGVTGLCAAMVGGRQIGVSLGYEEPPRKRDTRFNYPNIDRRMRTVRLWDVETGAVIGEPLNAGSVVSSIAVTAGLSPPTLITAHEGFVRLWNLETRMLIGDRIREDLGFVELFAAGFLAGREKVLFKRAGKYWMLDLGSDEVGEWPVDDGTVSAAVALSEGRSLVLTGDYNGRIEVWAWEGNGNVASGDPIDSQWAVAIARRDGRAVVASGGYDGFLRLWDAESGRAVGPPLAAHHGPVLRLAAAGRSPRSAIVSRGHDQRICVWDIKAGAHTEYRASGDNYDAAFAVGSFKNKPVIIEDAKIEGQRVLALSDVKTGKRLKELHRLLPGRRYTTLTAGTMRGIPVAVAAVDDGAVIGINLESGELIWNIALDRAQRITALLLAELEGKWVVVCGDGDRAMFGKRDSTVRILDVETGQPVGNPMREHCSSLYVSALTLIQWDGHPIIVSADSDGLLCVWKPGGQIIKRLNMGATVMDLAVTLRGTLIVAAARGLIALRFDR